MSNNNFHGAFILRDQGYGILSGTYLNNHDPKPYPETAILQTDGNNNDHFIGIFETVWLEKNDHYKCNLEIKLNGAGQYGLKWRGAVPGTKSYDGLGIIENGILIGCYWGI